MAVRRSGVARAGSMGALAGLLVAGLTVVPGGGAQAAADPGMSIEPMPVTEVSLAQAGEVVQWRSPYGSEDLTDVPASLAGVAVTQVAMSTEVGFAVTAAGRLVSWGSDAAGLQKIPAAVAATEVAQVAVSGAYAGVLTRAGTVLTWGTKRNFETPLNVPAGLAGVKQLTLNSDRALALRHDGTVVAWGAPAGVPGEPPAGLRATAITMTGTKAYALTVDGSVVVWGQNTEDLPDEVTEPGSVRAVAANDHDGGMAIRTDGSLIGWNSLPIQKIPATVLTSPDPVSILGNGSHSAVVDGDGVIHHWAPAPGATESGFVPAELNGRPLAQLALSTVGDGLAIVTKMLRGADPRVGGSPVVGQTLTGTPGTFSASPESVTSQWLADGAPIPGASGATLALTPALLGKAISYQSTATKTGETTISSTSAAVTVTNPPPVQIPDPPKVASTTKVVKVAVAKKGAKATVSGKVTAAKPVTGKATVSIKKGKKTILAKSVTVSAKGTVALTVKKFAALVAKKLKAKGKKAKTAYRGKYVVTIAYAGNAQVNASKASKKFTAKK